MKEKKQHDNCNKTYHKWLKYLLGICLPLERGIIPGAEIILYFIMMFAHAEVSHIHISGELNKLRITKACDYTFVLWEC